MTTTVDLDRLSLSHGEAGRLDLPVRPGGLALAGQKYATVPETIDVRLDVSRTSTGYAFRLRMPLAVEGPCMRCLDAASIATTRAATRAGRSSASCSSYRSRPNSRRLRRRRPPDRRAS